MKVGDTFEVKAAVTAADTAESLGSGGLCVLGTPRLAALMENAAYTLLQRSLSEGQSSVGTKIELSHVSPTPVGMTVRVTAEVAHTSENGKIIDFKVAGYDEAGLIGEGTHQRAIIDIERFMRKCQSKKES